MRKKSNWPFPSCIRQMGKNEHDEWTIATLYELLSSKSYKLVCARIEDTDQPAHSRSLSSVYDQRCMSIQVKGPTFFRVKYQDYVQTARKCRMFTISNILLTCNENCKTMSQTMRGSRGELGSEIEINADHHRPAKETPFR